MLDTSSIWEREQQISNERVFGESTCACVSDCALTFMHSTAMHRSRDKRNHVHVRIYADDGRRLHVLTENHKGRPFKALHIPKYKCQWRKVEFVEKTR